MTAIGAGFPRTGTLSTKAALEHLGFGPCYHFVTQFERPQDAEVWLAAARGHPVAVQDYVPAARLLVWEVKDGWEPLCCFLGVAMPDVPFPHLNDREAFQMLVRQAHEYGKA
jgi:hypothetical protein